MTDGLNGIDQRVDAEHKEAMEYVLAGDFAMLNPDDEEPGSHINLGDDALVTWDHGRGKGEVVVRVSPLSPATRAAYMKWRENQEW